MRLIVIRYRADEPENLKHNCASIGFDEVRHLDAANLCSTFTPPMDVDKALIADRSCSTMSITILERYRHNGIDAEITSSFESWLEREKARHEKMHDTCIARGWDLPPESAEEIEDWLKVGMRGSEKRFQGIS